MAFEIELVMRNAKGEPILNKDGSPKMKRFSAETGSEICSQYERNCDRKRLSVSDGQNNNSGN